MSGNQPGSAGSVLRWKYGLWAVFAGLLAICVVAVVGVLRYSTPSDAATAIAPVVAAISALTGAYFGVQIGSAGKEQSDAARDAAHSEAMKFAAIADPRMAQQLIEMSPGTAQYGSGRTTTATASDAARPGTAPPGPVSS
jgi:hypothetical protein